jgi:hypothetical protein
LVARLGRAFELHLLLLQAGQTLLAIRLTLLVAEAALRDTRIARAALGRSWAVIVLWACSGIDPKALRELFSPLSVPELLSSMEAERNAQLYHELRQLPAQTATVITVPSARKFQSECIRVLFERTFGISLTEADATHIGYQTHTALILIEFLEHSGCPAVDVSNRQLEASIQSYVSRCRCEERLGIHTERYEAAQQRDAGRWRRVVLRVTQPYARSRMLRTLWYARSLRTHWLASAKRILRIVAEVARLQQEGSARAMIIQIQSTLETQILRCADIGSGGAVLTAFQAFEASYEKFETNLNREKTLWQILRT